MESSILRVSDLSVSFDVGTRSNVVVEGVSFDVDAGAIAALVGESGSGKTMISRAILRLLPPGGRIVNGHIQFDGQDLVVADAARMLQVRGKRIGMVFQEPMTSLNPALTIGFQLTEAMKFHSKESDEECQRKALRMLERARISNAKSLLNRYPHEFSGGMRQRILLASVLTMNPQLIIADEPTTALDSLVQKEILEIMVEIAKEKQTAILLITHDLALVSQYADQVAVMREGRILQNGLVGETLLSPTNEYVRNLLESLPRREERPEKKAEVLVEARTLSVRYPTRKKYPWSKREDVAAVRDVSLHVRKGETLAVVGESGSGKSSLGRAMLGLLEASNGTVQFDGHDLSELDRKERRKLSKRAQMVFQDPYSALDPRMRIGALLKEGLRRHSGIGNKERQRKVEEMLAAVGLDNCSPDRYAHQLSGGQRQRVNIARALIGGPDFVVADEPVSALDVTVQAEILRLIANLQNRFGFSCLFISHDLTVVEQVADRVAVMYRGGVVEVASRDALFSEPRHPYTCQLIAAAPRLQCLLPGQYKLIADRPSSAGAPDGYTFDGWRGTSIAATNARMISVGTDQQVACFEKRN